MTNRGPNPAQRQTHQQAPQQAAASPRFSKEDAEKIITDGDAEHLVQVASSLGPGLQVNTTQLRRFFGEVKRIEMLWPQQPDTARRRAVLLKPRLTYQVNRQPQLQRLRDVLMPCLDLATKDEQHFQRFVEFYEALIAYTPRESRGGNA